MQGGGMPKLPDAVHVVSAIRAGCRVFVSNDERLELPVTIRKVRPRPDDIHALLKDLA
ncbi:hypothetical protein A33M_3453 [Rhodovulum sp. PH10]|nr:hypothetical protein A33M_3453 [Rhodovulum sp. PH10]